jgi:type II secretory ATPase GspE/PulE/Tfp pilus assembly ATPase PilB-like protein
MRILNKSAKALDIDKIGFSKFNLKKLHQEIVKPNGIIINTGPTGSGKTTTLYSILSCLNKPEVKIITVEDPIEYQIEGIIQTQTNQEEDYTFAKAMRSLLRQNPDIMMVGEIRDEETAQIAYRAALTGHLVVSTLHANSAAGSVQRLIDMGVDISDISSGTNCFIAQRLTRKLCPHCRRRKKLEEGEKNKILVELKSLPENLQSELEKVENIFEPVGCSECNGLGYKGMLPISEILQVDKEMESYFTQHPTTGEIEEKAIQNGMITLYQDGLIKVLGGEISLEEVERVAGRKSGSN